MELFNPMFEKILLSLAIGALIGIEREWRAKDGAKIFAGVRTFMLVCLSGVLTTYIAQLVSTMWPVYIGLVAIAGVTIMSYYINFKKFGIISLTTTVAFFLTYLIGILLFFEEQPYFMSISLGIILTLILFSRESLHSFARGLTKKEMRDAVIFAALVFIVLPLLPDETIDPYGALNPHLIWLSMVIVMSVAFAGYVAMKLLGERRGLGVMAMFGGLASSTSVALSMAERAKKKSEVIKSAVFATIVSSSTMFFRMVLVAMFFNQAVALSLLPFLGLLGAVGYVLSYVSWKKIKHDRATITLSSPISFKPVFHFMLIFIAVSFVSHITQLYYPSAIYIVTALSGMFDVDAITISMSSLSNGLPVAVIVNGIIAAALSNTFSKAILARWIGGKKAGEAIAKVFIPLLIIGAIIFAVRTISAGSI